jgi:hypothetical protein
MPGKTCFKNNVKKNVSVKGMPYFYLMLVKNVAGFL